MVKMNEFVRKKNKTERQTLFGKRIRNNIDKLIAI
jgi:hypothetical protein